MTPAAMVFTVQDNQVFVFPEEEFLPPVTLCQCWEIKDNVNTFFIFPKVYSTWQGSYPADAVLLVPITVDCDTNSLC